MWLIQHANTKPDTEAAAELHTSDTALNSQVDANASATVDAAAHPPPSISPTTNVASTQAVAAVSEEKSHPEREATTSTSTHVAGNEAASRSDPSIGTSQPSISLTGHDEKKREEDKSSWKAATLTIPVKPHRRRKSSKGASNGKGPAPVSVEKPQSIASTSESKPPAKKRQKISLLERITHFCTPRIRRTHEIDVEEVVTRPIETEKKEDATEKDVPKEVETTTQHDTREPSSATTSKRSSLVACYSGLTSTSSRGPSPGSRPDESSPSAVYAGGRYRYRCAPNADQAIVAAFRNRRLDVRCCATSRVNRRRDEA